MKLDVWGVEASPYLLKIESLLNYLGRDFRRLPRDGGRWENLVTSLRLGRARRRGTVGRYPAMDALDEYPSVPYLVINGTEFQYDSSAIAQWLDAAASSMAPPFYPPDPASNFVARLIDEAFDEYGLYMVHHQRWVCSATDNVMGETTAREMSRLLPPPLPALLRTRLPRRQVRRCPYLFSVAPDGYRADVEPLRVPPSRPGFPPTHTLLQESWHAYLAAMEALLAVQPFLLGEQFTAADASAYGQLSMNLIDPTAVASLGVRAPRTYRWLLDIRDGRHRGSAGGIAVSPALQPLLDVIMTTFAPLMAQNERAYRQWLDAGQTVFNEAAFERGDALYDGELLGHPFRAVAKTFQVRVWRDLCAQWGELDTEVQSALREILPGADLFEDAAGSRGSNFWPDRR
ncbi:MAG: glutathione S-transferase C-terminal domain-containing protein [Halioglobus sp.]|nr:glutathione S-transferase C-terminal domain-containing protein [Halioglobus sp.]